MRRAFLMPSPFFIVGPTAVGKTNLAVELAERCGAEIVSADALQIYHGFDLLTAKPTSSQQRRVRHHLIGGVPASEPYNVALYLEAARLAMADIFHRGLPAIVVGGSGLYVKALTHGLASLPAGIPALREELETLSQSDLLSRLRVLDPVTVSTIDGRNKRRLVRALEVCLVSGQPFSSFRENWGRLAADVPLCGVFLRRDRADLVARIDRRLDGMFADGVLEEVRASPVNESVTSERILGLAAIRSYLAGEIDFTSCREQIRTATRQYAKRQMTWFKRESCFHSVDASACPAASLLKQTWHHYEVWRSASVSRP